MTNEKTDKDAPVSPAARPGGVQPHAGLAEQRASGVGGVSNPKEVPVWERDDAPPGSTEGSLLRYENGVPVAVADPTHYHHLANGQVVAGYSGGTHYTTVDDDGNDVVLPIVARFAG